MTQEFNSIEQAGLDVGHVVAIGIEKSKSDKSKTPLRKELTLQSLFNRPADELRRLYLGAPEPTTLKPLHGDPVCSGLAIGKNMQILEEGHLLGFIGRRISKAASKPGFIWGGKSFRVNGDKTGRGINHFNVSGIKAAFEFKMDLRPSLLDGKKCIALDYSVVADNPGWHKPIFDEIREVAPGIYIGPAILLHGGKQREFAWFGVDTNQQAWNPLQEL